MISVTDSGSRIRMPLRRLATGPVLVAGARGAPGRVQHGFNTHHTCIRTQSIFAFLDLGRLFLLDARTGATALFHLCVLSVVGSMDLGRCSEIGMSFEELTHAEDLTSSA